MVLLIGLDMHVQVCTLQIAKLNKIKLKLQQRNKYD